MADDNKEKKSDRVPGINIVELFNNNKLIFIGVGVVILILLIVAGVAAFTRGSQKSATTVSPGMLTAVIVKGDDRFARRGEGGELVGIEPSLAQNLAEAEGLSLKIIEADSQVDALALLDTKAADVALGRISTDMGLTGYNLSTDYGNSALFLVTALHDYTDSLNLMTGYSVGILSNVKTISQSVPNIDFVSPKDYDNPVGLGEDIRDRVISMGIVSERDAVGLVKSFPSALQTQEITASPKEYYVAVFPANGAVHASIMNGVIANFGNETETQE